MNLGAEIRRLRALALAVGATSAKDVSETLGINIGIASYYVRDLASRKLLYVHSETRVRGAVQTHYRATPEGVTVLLDSVDELREAAEFLELILVVNGIERAAAA